MPGWRRSGGVRRLPKGWAAVRRAVFERDGGVCQHVRRDTGLVCGLPGSAVDHVVPRAEGGSDDLANLRVLCEWHHDKKSHEEALRGRARAARRRFEASGGVLGRHVGLID